MIRRSTKGLSSSRLGMDLGRKIEFSDTLGRRFHGAISNYSFVWWQELLKNALCTLILYIRNI